jgi:hypothetical protein
MAEKERHLVVDSLGPHYVIVVENQCQLLMEVLNLVDEGGCQPFARCSAGISEEEEDALSTSMTRSTAAST